MARPTRICPTWQSQEDGIAEPEKRAGALLQEKPEDVKNVKEVTDYKSEASEHSIVSDAQKEKIYSDAQYAAIELTQDGTRESHVMHKDMYILENSAHTFNVRA